MDKTFGGTFDLRSVPLGQRALLDSDRIVYVKEIEVDGKIVYGVHAADGTPIGWAADRALAFAALRQEDLEPVSVN